MDNQDKRDKMSDGHCTTAVKTICRNMPEEAYADWPRWRTEWPLFGLQDLQKQQEDC